MSPFFIMRLKSRIGFTAAIPMAEFDIGDIVRFNGKKYRITNKKVAVYVDAERYYWFNALAEWIGGVFGKL